MHRFKFKYDKNSNLTRKQKRVIRKAYNDFTKNFDLEKALWELIRVGETFMRVEYPNSDKIQITNKVL